MTDPFRAYLRAVSRGNLIAHRRRASTLHYYNENDPHMAAWLRELIRAGLIPEGDVDDRSILDVSPDDLRGYVACHFFAGIGGWPYALRLAGWPDDRPVWTGSPPCQPFSSAGQRRAAGDERHLAPAFLKLARAAQPAVLFGEQVASSAVVGKVAGGAKRGAAGPRDWAWLDGLSDGLEAAGYAVGAGDVPAAGVGAPHIRQRLFFGAVRLGPATVAAGGGGRVVGLADAERERLGGAAGTGLSWGEQRPACDSESSRLAQPLGAGLEGHAGDGVGGAEPGRKRTGPDGPTAAQGDAGRLGDADDERHQGCSQPGIGEGMGDAGPQSARAGADRGLADSALDRRGEERPHARGLSAGDGTQGRAAGHGAGGDPDAGRPGAADDPWRDADWLLCRDGKWRPVEPALLRVADGLLGGMVRGGTERSAAYPLSEEARARVIRLRGYGNAIVPQAAAEFVKAFAEACFRDGTGSGIIE